MIALKTPTEKMVYCSQGHHNPPGNRFCQTCGQAIQQSVTGEIPSGTVLGDRYRIIKQLGQGGFGRTYLAEDTNRFNEQCVLKEFAPKIHGTYALKKAEELFTREAGVLYKFQHPQIPQFRELSRFKVGTEPPLTPLSKGGESGLFLVQDYVAGQTYRAILTHRQHQGYLFNEAEVLELLRQLLPVLDYIHSQGVIHRDIAPDNLILRSSDQLPVLIDFGGVKEIAATIQQSQSVTGKKTKTPRVSTRVGKLGYAPEEQMLLGQVYPHSDLYAVAVTVLVLLTGKEPQALFDSHNMCWVWQKFVTVSPTLTIVLDKMLSRQKSDRFQSATEVLQALGFCSSGSDLSPPFLEGGSLQPQSIPSPSIPNRAPNLPTQSPEFSQSVSRSAPPTAVSLPPSAVSLPPTAPPQPAHQEVLGLLGKLVLFFAIAIVAGSGGWWLTTRWLQSNHSQNVTNDSIASESDNGTESSEFADKTEAELKAEFQEKRKALGINNQFLIRLVDDQFYAQYPEQKGISLTNKPEDEKLRREWNRIGLELLNKLETLSQPARDQLGKYRRYDFIQWQRDLEHQNLNPQQLPELTDRQFFTWFPDQEEEYFINQPIGQLWYAIGFDQFTALQN